MAKQLSDAKFLRRVAQNIDDDDALRMIAIAARLEALDAQEPTETVKGPYYEQDGHLWRAGKHGLELVGAIGDKAEAQNLARARNDAWQRRMKEAAP